MKCLRGGLGSAERTEQRGSTACTYEPLQWLVLQIGLHERLIRIGQAPPEEDAPLQRVSLRRSTPERSELAASASGTPLDSAQSWLLVRGLPKVTLLRSLLRPCSSVLTSAPPVLCCKCAERGKIALKPS